MSNGSSRFDATPKTKAYRIQAHSAIHQVFDHSDMSVPGCVHESRVTFLQPQPQQHKSKPLESSWANGRPRNLFNYVCPYRVFLVHICSALFDRSSHCIQITCPRHAEEWRHLTTNSHTKSD